MKVLLTGAFGNEGISSLDALLAQGHEVRCLDLPTPANRRAARRYGDRIGVVWGDVRNPADVAQAVRDQDVVVHLAYIIPKLSVTGIGSEDRPELAREVNVGGTCNLVDACLAQPKPPRFLFTSSLHVFGRTHDLLPPRTVNDPVQATEHYSQHKIECEEMLRTSGLTWSIFRLGAVLPLAIKLDPGMFDVPLDNRIEYVHTRDVGLAIANAVKGDDVWGKVLLIGGGPRCQLTFRQVTETVLAAAGVGMLPDNAFATIPFPTDWLDTTESEALLHYQRYDLKDYAREMAALLGWRRGLAHAFRPLVRGFLLRQSPHLRRKAARPTG